MPQTQSRVSTENWPLSWIFSRMVHVERGVLRAEQANADLRRALYRGEDVEGQKYVRPLSPTRCLEKGFANAALGVSLAIARMPEAERIATRSELWEAARHEAQRVHTNVKAGFTPASS